MYDTYSDYYGMNDVEVQEVKTIGEDVAPMYRPKPYYTITFEPVPMTAQERQVLYSYSTKLKNQAHKHIKCLERFESTPERDFVISECWDIINTEFVSMEHYQFVHWYFNFGNLRDEDELERKILHIKAEQEKQEQLAFQEKLLPFKGGIWMIVTFLAVFFLPGMLISLPALSQYGSTEYWLQSIFVNIIIWVIGCPILLAIWGLLCMAFPSGKGKLVSGKGVATTAAVSAAMHTKAVSNMGKTLFSSKKI